MNDKTRHVERLLYKAANDLRSARDLGHTAKPASDVICFHCQQAAEKFLKAWLLWHDIRVPRTHNIAELLEICKRGDPSFAQLQPAEALTPYAVELRYADDFYLPPMPEALAAIEVACKVDEFVRARFAPLGVSVPDEFPSDPSS